MNKIELNEKYKTQLMNSIPVVSGMNISIEEITSDSVTLKAPLNTHINYEGTAFGGSLNTLAILSAYLLCHHTMRENGIDFQSLVIQDSSIKYKKPVHSDFYAKASMDEGDKKRFLDSLYKKNVGRALVNSRIYCVANCVSNCGAFEDISVEFKGRFVAKVS